MLNAHEIRGSVEADMERDRKLHQKYEEEATHNSVVHLLREIESKIREATRAGESHLDLPTNDSAFPNPNTNSRLFVALTSALRTFGYRLEINMVEDWEWDSSYEYKIRSEYRIITIKW